VSGFRKFVLRGNVVYYFVVLPVGRLMARFSPDGPAPAPTRECPYCLSKIPVKAVRCAFCTADVGDQVMEPAGR
jgi:large conductance mechanosensitive channel